ncbi:MAG: hypothetical protein IT443_13255 [Phycisphaeraceae bacterium]|nr:hypothetical protein [Phycisphaeraceae bacterium]
MSDRSEQARFDSSSHSRFQLETLEPRLLLTTLLGGDNFSFQDAEGQRINISVGGNVIVEVLGATMGANGDVIIHQMPGEFFESSFGRRGANGDPRLGGVLGGFGAAKGVIPVTLDDQAGAHTEIQESAGFPGIAAPGEFEINALATNAAGDVYGLTYAEVPGLFGLQRFVYLLSLDTSTGEATPVRNLYSQLLGIFDDGDLDTPAPEIIKLSAADFNPLDDLMYFVARITTPVSSDIDYLLRVNVTTGLVQALGRTIGGVFTPEAFADSDTALVSVESIVFDQVGAGPDYTNNVYLWAYLVENAPQPDGGVQPEGRVVRFNVTGAAGSLPTIRTDLRPVWRTVTDASTSGVGVEADIISDITGIEFGPDDPNAAETTMFAVNARTSDSSLWQIDLSSGAAENWGPLSDPNDPDASGLVADIPFQDGAVRGENIGALAWSDDLPNPFTGETGVMLGTDISTDELLFIDTRQRFPFSNAFLIYVTQGDPNGWISASVTEFDETTGILTYQIFDSDAGQFRIFPANNPGTTPTVTISAPAETGGALLGIRTLDRPNITEDDLILTVTAAIREELLDSNGALGALPAGMGTVWAGVQTAKSLLAYVSNNASLADKTMGANLDLIRGMSIKRDGTDLVVIDTDAKDADGVTLGAPADQLAFINPSTGKLVGSPISITYLGNPLQNVMGLDYGDPDFNGVEVLYAVYSVEVAPGVNELRLGTINTATGVFTSLGQLDAAIESVQAIAFAPTQELYMVAVAADGKSRLYEIDPADGSTLATIGLLIDDATDVDLSNIGAMDFEADLTDGRILLLAHDRHNGRLVDIDITDARVGKYVATETGSLRPTVGAFTYERGRNRFLVADNVTSQLALGANETIAPNAESAVLMRMVGFTSTSAVPQDLNRILWAGTVTGKVDISGSMQMFYAGWLITGSGRGQGEGTPTYAGNFHVGGDLQLLVTKNAIGTSAAPSTTTDDHRPVYLTGFDMVVDGRLGSLRTFDSFVGSLSVGDWDSVDGFTFLYSYQRELEERVPTGVGADAALGALFADEGKFGYVLGSDSFAFITNDSPDTAQYLGTLRNSAAGVGSVRMLGRLDAADDYQDYVDYYALGLMAGQAVTVQLLSGQLFHVALIDPDGRVAATDYSNVKNDHFWNQPFQFVADRPGIYYFAVARDGDLNFNGITDDPVASTNATADYELRISNAGQVSLGGLVATMDIFSTSTARATLQVVNGDVGAIVAQNQLYFDPLTDSYLTGSAHADIQVVAGDLRAIFASFVGNDITGNETDVYLDPEIEVIAGSIGLIRATNYILADIGNVVYLADQGVPSGSISYNIAPIGGNIQMIDAGYGAASAFDGFFRGNVRAKGGIGVLRATDGFGDVTGNIDTSFEVDSDRQGADGIIDLITIGGHWGSFANGGPALDTGVGGNIRFIDLLPGTDILSIYNDRFFGGTYSAAKEYLPGESATFLDDSGAEIKITPLQDVPNPAYNPTTNPNAPKFLPNYMTVVYLGVRSGGGVVAAVDLGGRDVIVNGVQYSSLGGVLVEAVRGDRAEIGRILVNPPLVALPDPSDDDPTFVQIWPTLKIIGEAKIDVFDIQAPDQALKSVLNESGKVLSGVTLAGDIVNGHIFSVENLYAQGNLGVGTGSFSEALLRNYIMTDAIPEYLTVREDGGILYPFQDQRSGIVIARNDATPTAVQWIAAGQAVGNLLVAGDINRLGADWDKNFKPNDNIFEGIAGPIWATDIYNDAFDSSVIGTVNIGEGIAPSGSGAFSWAGIYAGDNIDRAGQSDGGVINEVINNGLYSDIMGDIIATRTIGKVSLKDGAIINADILIVRDPFSASELVIDPLIYAWIWINQPGVKITSIGDISLQGQGGIIGSFIGGHYIDSIKVSGGFGMLNSRIKMSLDGTMGNLTVDGYGIRGMDIFGGVNAGNITANGQGQMISTSSFTSSVYRSETGQAWQFGHALSVLSDLHYALGTSATQRTLAGVTDAGVIEDVDLRFSGKLGTVSAYQIRTRNGTESASGLTSFSVGNSIAGIKTSDIIDGLSVVTGRIDSFMPAKDVNNLQLTFAGLGSSLIFRGNVSGDSSINATGPSALINSITVAGNMAGDITVAGRVNTISIAGNLTGSIVIKNPDQRYFALNSLTLGGSLTNGSLDIQGNVNSIQSAASLGSSGDSLVIRGNLNNLKVGAGKGVLNAVLGLDLIVQGNLRMLDVVGRIAGSLLVQGDLTTLNVRNPAIGLVNLISAPVSVQGTLGGATLTNGHVTGNVQATGGITRFSLTGGDLQADLIAGRDVGTVTITNGDLAAGSEITSALGNVNSVTIRNGDLLGSVRAPNGTIGTVGVQGSDLGPLAVLEGKALRSLTIDGSIRSGAVIDVLEALTTLTVKGAVEAGATITAGSAGTLNVTGAMAGDLTIGNGGRATNLMVGGNLGGVGSDVTFAGDASITTRGSVLAGTDLSVGGDLTMLQVTGALAGNVLVDGKATRVNAASMNTAALIVGSDLTNLTVTGAISASLIQVGAIRGDDGTFAAGKSRMATLGGLSAGTISSSIIASGGDITRVNATTSVANTSISSGLALGGAEIDSVVGGLDLSIAGNRILTRQNAVLYRGDIGTASFGRPTALGADTVTASQITAGIDPGDGDFTTTADNVVSTSLTGGASKIGSLTGKLDAASYILADGSVRSTATGAGLVNTNANVTYAIADLTANNALETLVGSATSAAKLIFTANGGATVTITVTGPGQVQVYDETGAGTDSDNVIDTLVLTGTTTATRVTIVTSTPGAVSIGRILSADDAVVGTLAFDGDLAGDGSDDPDLWIDGPMTSLTFRDFSDDFAGKIGGDVGTISFQTQGGGALYIGGTVRTMTIVDSAGSGLLEALHPGAAAFTAIRSLSVSAAGQTWAFDTATGQLGRLDLTTGALIGVAGTVTDAFSGATLTVSGMDFGIDTLAAEQLFAVAQLLDMSTTVQVGALDDVAVTLRHLAVNSSGQVFAIQTVAGIDHLVRLNPTTGAIAEDRGQLRDVFTNTYTDNFRGLAFDASNNLYALVSDRDGPGGPTAVATTLVKIESIDTNSNGYIDVTGPSGDLGVQLNGGAVTDIATALAVSSGGTLYAITHSGGNDTLVTIALDGTMTSVGVVNAGGATNIVGMGFDANGNLVGLSNVAGVTTLVQIDTTTPGSSIVIGTPGIISGNVDAFVIRGNTTYAYDTDDVVGGIFLTNPGLVATLGTIDTATRQFTRIQSLARNATGTALNSAVLDVAVAAGAGGHVFVLTADNQLWEYDQDGNLQNGGAIGLITDIRDGATLTISALDFNAGGELVGVDEVFNRLVTINTATAQATARTDVGVLNATRISDVAFHPTLAPNPGFISFRADTGSLVHLRATTQAEYEAIAGGITARSIGRLNLGSAGGAYGGRITTTGNTFDSVDVQGDFTGRLATEGSILAYNQRTGNFGGALSAAKNIGRVSIMAGSIQDGSLIRARGALTSLDQRGGTMGGIIEAGSSGALRFTGNGTATAAIRISGVATSVYFTGNFAGLLEVGSLTSGLTVTGLLDATAEVLVAGSTGTTTLTGGTAVGSLLQVGGNGTTLTVGGTHRGTLAFGGNLTTARVAAMQDAILMAGMDLGTFTASGSVIDSLISAGVAIGADGLYNTADDVIYGGSIRNATFMGDLTNSALVAGVLPDASYGPGIPSSPLVYTGDQTPADVTAYDSAEAGGILPSKIERVTVRGDNSGSALAAANAIGTVTGKFVGTLYQRTYADPIGAPTVVDSYFASDEQFWVVFSEEVNTAFFTLSVDTNNDGLLNGPADVQGSITVRDDLGNVLDDVTLEYVTQTDAYGQTQGVLKIIRIGGFDPDNAVASLDVTLAGNAASPTLVDRSGLRSVLRDFNQDGVSVLGEDPLGTVLDGDGDGSEGGDSTAAVLLEGAGSFLTAASHAALPLVVNQPVTLAETFSNEDDIDIYRITASAYQFLSFSFTADMFMQMALFYQDDQGTTLIDDDSFEAMARYEFHFGGTTTQALELPYAGNYYLALVPYFVNSIGTYQLSLSLAATDDQLDGSLNGDTGLDPDVQVGYVSNTVGQNNNLLGANKPKQLVYLNFDGGRTTQYSRDTDVQAFDASLLNGDVDGYEDVLIDGGMVGITSITGIVDNILAIYQDTPATNPLGQLNVQRFDAADLASITQLDDLPDGLIFTTVDPTTVAGFGSLSAVDFTTVFIGQTDTGWQDPGTLGIAADIDVANMEKADEAVVLLQNFTVYAVDTDLVTELSQYSRALANVAAHELGHVLGLNHQPTDGINFRLVRDDPANGLLAAMHDGAGVDNAAGLADFRITQRNGSTFNINIDTALTVQDVVDLINNTANIQVTAAIDATNARLTLTDASTGGSTFRVTALNGSTAATDLGILKTAAAALINGDPVLTTNSYNAGPGLMAYADDAATLNELNQLGTAILTPTEFEIGNIDTAELLLRWLA